MNYYNQIKKEFINNELTKKVKDYSKNKSDLMTYYNVGKLLIEAQGGETRAKYGNKLIKEYSEKLTKELGRKYSYTLLWRARKFYLNFNHEKVSTMSTLLQWSHYVELLSIKNINEINYYIKITESQKLSVRELRERIKNKEYERLPNETKEKLKYEENKSKYEVIDFVPNPIVIKSNIKKEISEKILQKLIMEDLYNFYRGIFIFISNKISRR